MTEGRSQTCLALLFLATPPTALMGVVQGRGREHSELGHGPHMLVTTSIKGPIQCPSLGVPLLAALVNGWGGLFS